MSELGSKLSEMMLIGTKNQKRNAKKKLSAIYKASNKIITTRVNPKKVKDVRRRVQVGLKTIDKKVNEISKEIDNNLIT